MGCIIDGYLATYRAPIVDVFIDHGLSGMTKQERTEFGTHVRVCEPCQETVCTELLERDVVAQLQEARRRIGGP